MNEPKRQPTMAETDILIRAFAAKHDIAYDTVLQLVASSDLRTPPAETLARLESDLMRGLVLHSTAAKGQSRKNIRKRDPRRKPKTQAPSKKRTAAERRAATDKLREHRRKMA